ncbi:DUF935 domain-containing protein [Sphingomonas canadensis]|uniref:DUF935 domain-containing protein n=1 Tax=Sphingomonas canadensis TaxID=1219257 RepID=A0ABW3H807_9SPHN|nr:DUF935 domain-containing protein [Sphingomonas canadensis]MCW3835982.1 DUF935 domain-containing protein [Sphingomonas canadensis]
MADAYDPYAPPPPPVLVDSAGRPLRSAAPILTKEIAAPVMTGTRSIVTGHPAEGLDPAGLARILRQAEDGDATAQHELAEQLEEKWPHYRSVLRTRKLAVAQLPIEVEAAGDTPEEEADAQLLRDWLKRPTMQAELVHIQDALGKGFSATEVMWNLAETPWLPESLQWADPRFFEYDRVTGRRLLLKGGVSGMAMMAEELPPYKFIVHEAQEKSGLPIRGGIARAAAWYYLFLNFTIKDWITFLEVYGLPLRVGKYQNGTSEADIRKLAQAVAQIGSDAGCVIPQSMLIEFIESGGAASNPEMFSRFLAWVNDEISKLVLGQTSSADAKSGGLGTGQADLHGEVRKDIRDFDAMLLSVTLTSTIGKWIVQFNRGHRKRYPIIRVGEPDAVDMDRELKAIDKAVEYGVPVGMGHFRKVTGVPAPEDGEELLVPPRAAQEPQNGDPRGGGIIPPQNAASRLSDPLKPKIGADPAGPAGAVAAAAQDAPREPDAIDRLVDDAIAASGGFGDAMIAGVEELISGAASLEEVREILAMRAGDALAAMPADQFTELLARSSFATRLAGLLQEPGK